MCSGLSGLTCGQCMRDQKGCSAVAEKVTWRGTTTRKEAGGAKPMATQEAAGGSEPGPSGQRRPSRQAAARAPIVEVEESAEERDASEDKGEFPSRHRNVS